MIFFIDKFRTGVLFRIFSLFLIFSFSTSLVLPPKIAQAQNILNLPAAGGMISVSPSFTPVIIRGLKVHPDNPLKFDFIVDSGDADLNEEEFNKETTRLIKYFLASLTIPEEDLWVNLSPYEANRIIPEKLALTEMGRDLLAQDYILKQLSSSLTYPESELGQKFWKKIRAKANWLYGTSDIPMDAFNKVWIVPQRAEVFETSGTAFVADSYLKVMMEEDYLASQEAPRRPGTQKPRSLDQAGKLGNQFRGVSSEIIREIIIPAIEKEVNQGKNFAKLRQIYNSIILGIWFKQNLQNSLLGQVYVNKNKIAGVDVADKQIKEKIYQRYLQAYKQGVYNYIKEDYEKSVQHVVPRKYFSGGIPVREVADLLQADPAALSASGVAGLQTWVPSATDRERLRRVVVRADEVNAEGRPADAAMLSGPEAQSPDLDPILADLTARSLAKRRAAAQKLENEVVIESDDDFRKVRRALRHALIKHASEDSKRTPQHQEIFDALYAAYVQIDADQKFVEAASRIKPISQALKRALDLPEDSLFLLTVLRDGIDQPVPLSISEGGERRKINNNGNIVLSPSTKRYKRFHGDVIATRTPSTRGNIVELTVPVFGETPITREQILSIIGELSRQGIGIRAINATVEIMDEDKMVLVDEDSVRVAINKDGESMISIKAFFNSGPQKETALPVDLYEAYQELPFVDGSLQEPSRIIPRYEPLPNGEKIRVFINGGAGRIGGLSAVMIIRDTFDHPDMQLVAINGGSAKDLERVFLSDSAHWKGLPAGATTRTDKDSLGEYLEIIIPDRAEPYKIYAYNDRTSVSAKDWLMRGGQSLHKIHRIDGVLDASDQLSTGDGLKLHIDRGAKYAVYAAPFNVKKDKLLAGIKSRANKFLDMEKDKLKKATPQALIPMLRVAAVSAQDQLEVIGQIITELENFIVEVDIPVVMGVNDHLIAPEHRTLDNRSCTTTCTTPIESVMGNEVDGITWEIKTLVARTVHPPTASQGTVDRRPREGRNFAAWISNILSTTGAGNAVLKVLNKVLPYKLKPENLYAFSIRVPGITGSALVTDRQIEVKGAPEGYELTEQAVLERLERFERTDQMQGIIEIKDDVLSSHEIIGSGASAVVLHKRTRVYKMGHNKYVARTVKWYDNEWGFSRRAVDLMRMVGAMKKGARAKGVVPDKMRYLAGAELKASEEAQAAHEQVQAFGQAVAQTAGIRLTAMGLLGAYQNVLTIADGEQSDEEKLTAVWDLMEQLYKNNPSGHLLQSLVLLTRNTRPNIIQKSHILNMSQSFVTFSNNNRAEVLVILGEDIDREQKIIKVLELIENRGQRDDFELLFHFDLEIRLRDTRLTELEKGKDGYIFQNIRDAINEAAQVIYADVAREMNVILRVRASRTAEVDSLIIPGRFLSEASKIQEAIRRKRTVYVSDSGEKVAIAGAVIDVDGIATVETGAISLAALGPAVDEIGTVPEGYAPILATNLGEHAEAFRQETVTVDGTTYHLDDIELYARHPQMIRKYLEFLAKVKGRSHSELWEEFIILDRPREQALITELKRLQRTEFTEIKIIEIRGGTVVPGLRAILPEEQFQELTGLSDQGYQRKYRGYHSTLLTFAGTSKATVVNSLAGAFTRWGAVSTVRYVSQDVNIGEQGRDATSYARRYDWNEAERGFMGVARRGKGDAEAILEGRKAFRSADTQALAIQVWLSFLSDNPVFEQSGVEISNGQTTVVTLYAGIEDGQPFARMITENGEVASFMGGESDLGGADSALLTQEAVQGNVEGQVIRHVPTDQQVLYAQSFEEMLMIVNALYDMGIKDDELPYIVLLDPEGKPIGRVGNGAVLVNPNFRTDRKFPRETVYLTSRDEYPSFRKPRDLEVSVIGATRAGGRDYPAAVEEEPVPEVLAEVLDRNGIPLNLYAVGEKVAHVIREFFRGGRTQLFPNERAFSEGTAKPRAVNVAQDRHGTLSQNMDPLIDRLEVNLKNPLGITLQIEGEESLSGEIIESSDDFLVLRRLDNFSYYSTKDDQEAIDWGDFVRLSPEERNRHSKVRVPQSKIRTENRDAEAGTIIHVVNEGATDLVAHAANEEWSIEALEKADERVARVFRMLDETGTIGIFTGDHGNIESIIDPLGRPDTKHTTNQVGLAIRLPAVDGRPARLLPLATPEDSDLTQIYATLLQMLNIEVPDGKNPVSLAADGNYRLEVGASGRRQALLYIFDGLGIPDPQDTRSPYNKANIPNIRNLFDMGQGAGRVGRLYAHRRFVGTREPMGKTNEELAALIRKRKPTQVHLPVEGQYFNNVFTSDPSEARRFLQEDFESGNHYQNLEAGDLTVVEMDAEAVAQMLETDPFYQDKRFAIEGFSEGRLLVLIDDGQIGGSEQGHYAIGIGEHRDRPIKQIDDMIHNGDFFREGGPNDNVIQAIKSANLEGREFHIDIFLQEAGVHSSILHLEAWLKLLHQLGVSSERVFIHAAVDGRDSAKDIGLFYLEELQAYLEDLGQGTPYGQVVTIAPRSNHERDVTLSGRVKIDHFVQVTGEIPPSTEESPSGFFDVDDKGGSYDLEGFTLARGRALITALERSRFEIERRQWRERIAELKQRVSGLNQNEDVAGFIAEVDTAMVTASVEDVESIVQRYSGYHDVRGGMVESEDVLQLLSYALWYMFTVQVAPEALTSVRTTNAFHMSIQTLQNWHRRQIRVQSDRDLTYRFGNYLRTQISEITREIRVDLYKATRDQLDVLEAIGPVLQELVQREDIPINLALAIRPLEIRQILQARNFSSQGELREANFQLSSQGISAGLSDSVRVNVNFEGEPGTNVRYVRHGQGREPAGTRIQNFLVVGLSADAFSEFSHAARSTSLTPLKLTREFRGGLRILGGSYQIPLDMEGNRFFIVQNADQAMMSVSQTFKDFERQLRALRGQRTDLGAIDTRLEPALQKAVIGLKVNPLSSDTYSASYEVVFDHQGLAQMKIVNSQATDQTGGSHVDRADKAWRFQSFERTVYNRDILSWDHMGVAAIYFVDESSVVFIVNNPRQFIEYQIELHEHEAVLPMKMEFLTIEQAIAAYPQEDFSAAMDISDAAMISGQQAATSSPVSQSGQDLVKGLRSFNDIPYERGGRLKTLWQPQDNKFVFGVFDPSLSEEEPAAAYEIVFENERGGIRSIEVVNSETDDLWKDSSEKEWNFRQFRRTVYTSEGTEGTIYALFFPDYPNTPIAIVDDPGKFYEGDNFELPVNRYFLFMGEFRYISVEEALALEGHARNVLERSMKINDSAMLGFNQPSRETLPAPFDPSEALGGIDATKVRKTLQIRRDGNGVALPVNMQPPDIELEHGLAPLIIEVVPMTTLPFSLSALEADLKAVEVSRISG